MPGSLTRRGFLATPAGIAMAAIPKLKITAVELVRLNGERDTPQGVNLQHQVQALHIYDEYRPRGYARRAHGQNDKGEGLGHLSAAESRLWP